MQQADDRYYLDYKTMTPHDNANNNGGDFDEHLPNPDHPKLQKTHEGEHHGDFGNEPVKITRSTYIYAFCAAVNSCNLGYDIGVSTEAGKLIEEDFGLTRIQREIFVGSINFWASKYRQSTRIVLYCMQTSSHVGCDPCCFLTFSPLFRWIFLTHSVWCVGGPVFYRYLWAKKNIYCCSCWFHYGYFHHGVFEYLRDLDVWPSLCGPRGRRRTRGKFVCSLTGISCRAAVRSAVASGGVSGEWCGLLYHMMCSLSKT
jgi:hypothetical protein